MLCVCCVLEQGKGVGEIGPRGLLGPDGILGEPCVMCVLCAGTGHCCW